MSWRGAAAILVVGATAGAAVATLARPSDKAHRAAIDSLSLEISRNADSARAWAAARAGLALELEGLRDDSARLERQRRAARLRGDSAADSLGKLLRLIADTSARSSAGAAVRSILEAGASCQASLTNCEQRASNAEARARGDSSRAAQEARLRAKADSAWQDEARRAAAGERRCGLGGSAGYSFPGWRVTVGATCTGLRLFRLPKLF